jgi:hypothetical protein
MSPAGELPNERPLYYRTRTADAPQNNRTVPGPSRARDNRIRDKDNGTRRRTRDVYDGIEEPYLLDELEVRLGTDFVRTPVSERCVFCNATYAGETKVKLTAKGYAVKNHVWIVDFYRANNVDFSEPVEGLLMIWSKKWRNAGLGDPEGAFAGLCAVSADKGRNIIAIETNLEARL